MSSATQTTAHRRVPPPCWTDDEAHALISVFKDKWCSLGRTNLKANDWDDVATAVAARFPLVSPSKTAVQCRHKMEKLRKRYRSEKQRASARPGRFSSWALYLFMDDLESESAKLNSGSDPDHKTRKGGVEFGVHRKAEGNSSFLAALDEFVSQGTDGASGFPVQSLGHRSLVPLEFTTKSFGKSNEQFNPKLKLKNDMNHGVGTRVGFSQKFRGDWDSNAVGFKDSEGSSSLLRTVRKVDPIEEMVSSIELLGEKYVKVEKRKMEMAREIVMMQMDMEMKQNQVIMESQKQMVNACVSALLESKKKKKKKKIKVVSPDS